MSKGRILWYLIATLLISIDLAYKIFAILDKSEGRYKISLESVLIATGWVYFFLMLIFSICKSKEEEEKKRRNCFKDYFFKYIYSISVGVLLLSGLIFLMYTGIDNPQEKDKTKKDLFLADLLFCYIGFPLICNFELWMTPRRRCPHPTIDVLVITSIVFFLNFLGYFFPTLQKVELRQSIALFIIDFIFSFDGYALYDYLCYLKNKGSYDYSLLAIR